MDLSVRRRRRPAAALLALSVSGIVACEDAAEFTEPETVAFTAVAIDKATVRPREGARLTAGPTEYALDVDVRWQAMPAPSLMGVWLETHDSVAGQTFRWEGDLVAALDTLNGAAGTTRFATTFTLPEVSPFCGSYDYVRILAVAFPNGEPPPNEAYRDEVFYQVSGSDWTGPCVADVFSIFPGSDFRVGEPVLVYGRGLPDALDVSLPGAQQDDNVWPGFVRVPEGLSLLPVPNDGYMIAFVPVGAETGRVRAFAGGEETRYAAEGVVSLNVAASAADVFEPNDSPALATDSIYFGLWDPFGLWGVYGFNPSLTLTGADRTPDSLSPDYGVGDWFFLLGLADPASSIDVCVNVASHIGDLDDIDVYVYDEGGAIVAQGATASGSEAVRLDDVTSSDLHQVWVTPYLPGFNSAAGGYTYEVGRCAAASGTAIARPDGPVAFFASGGAAPPAGALAGRAQPRQPSLGVIGTGGTRVPVANLWQRGGER